MNINNDDFWKEIDARSMSHKEEVKILKAERDTAWEELRKIREVIGANPEESTYDEVVRVIAEFQKEQPEYYCATCNIIHPVQHRGRILQSCPTCDSAMITTSYNQREISRLRQLTTKEKP